MWTEVCLYLYSSSQLGRGGTWRPIPFVLSAHPFRREPHHKNHMNNRRSLLSPGHHSPLHPQTRQRGLQFAENIKTYTARRVCIVQFPAQNSSVLLPTPPVDNLLDEDQPKPRLCPWLIFRDNIGRASDDASAPRELQRWVSKSLHRLN